MKCMATVWASNWMNCPCTAASTTWLSLPRSTSERHRGAEGHTHTHARFCQNVSTLNVNSSRYLQTASRIFFHSDQKAKKGKEGRDPVDMVKFSKVKSGIKVKHVHLFCIVIVCYLKVPLQSESGCCFCFSMFEFNCVEDPRAEFDPRTLLSYLFAGNVNVLCAN